MKQTKQNNNRTIHDTKECNRKAKHGKTQQTHEVDFNEHKTNNTKQHKVMKTDSIKGMLSRMLAYSWIFIPYPITRKMISEFGTHNFGTHIPSKEMYTREQGQAAVLVPRLTHMRSCSAHGLCAMSQVPPPKRR